MNLTPNNFKFHPPAQAGISNLLIVSITPYFLEKDVFWFQENLSNILKNRNSQTFFEDNIIFLEEGQSHSLAQLLRKIDEMGYERVFKVQEPGEFSQRGGIIDIFPINMLCAARMDFLGSELESIKILENTKLKDEKKTREIFKKRLKSQKLFSDLKNLKSGDFLVHLDHGVGRFIGIEKFEFSSSKLEFDPALLPFTKIQQVKETPEKKEYYVLEYDEGDRLYVPLGLERKLSRYIAFSDPKISRLASPLWQKTKRLIKEEIEKLAKELLALYAKKEIAKRDPYELDEVMESELRSGFVYQETPDQLQTVEDIKRDLEKETPMDRIVCGDVGFGKTEIALRAALIAASNNRQTAVICPTTILANQHFLNFEERFDKLAVTTAMLSRLQTKQEQKKILNDLEAGRIDVLIGTHRILSNDVKFKNLQLLIIDDEQRFGVKQKEKLRQKNPSLDILSLSATPIPRTIYLALSSFKNISLMQTAPAGRKQIKTKILPYKEEIIRSAIDFELRRKGQIYFLHNRVESLEKTKQKLEELSPNAVIELIHGRMPEKKIVEIMNKFQNREIDILLATTIIENGIDLPRVNTIIIEDATRLGLSKAHQIRGRVGRSDRESFAYFLFNPKELTPLAKERLNVLADVKELGSGYQIAIKDLELRGAGNILGKEQSGAINKIGLNLYSQILSEAVEKLRQ